ncbi:MAG: hypothetical protein IPK16_10980 [Anaerolineales bacterium]|nr:hypothetical protein [Anaerolineales bacterium]
MASQRFRIGDAVVGLTVLFGLLLLVGCTAVAPASPAAPAASEGAAGATPPVAPEAPGTCVVKFSEGDLVTRTCSEEVDEPALLERAAVCNDIASFDAANADEIPGNGGLPIAWTFGVNFDQLSAADNPLGCFRLYWLDEASSEFVPIDDGGVVIDTCQRIKTTSDDVPQVAGGAAVFAGAGGVTCHMNIAAWANDQAVRRLAEMRFAPDVFRKISSELDAFTQTNPQTYTNLTMVAAVPWPEDCCKPTGEEVGAVMPVVRYAPSPDNGVNPTIQLLERSDLRASFVPTSCDEEPNLADDILASLVVDRLYRRRSWCVALSALCPYGFRDG